MPINRIRPLLVAAPLVLLGACAEDDFGIESANSTFGEAVNQTMALQVIDPEPVYDGPMTGQGVQAAGAYDRYAKGQVKQPDRVSTTDVEVN